ncbi:MAG TPA: OmpA family protein [Aliidongia sp.]|uniref:OmpA family protein n=1 Tax=Aliidongia sp. TaxID=1914230 RepID=UPI002DDC9E89|nr:OmpA family protein [Aliidongia sp.]HEV2674916.1 OmpA family protein [Aliidongia sp.]
MGNGKVRAGGFNKKSWRTAAAMAGLVAIGGCSTLESANPINWFRDAKNDPGADAANSANLEAGSQQPYPSLASVPATPTRGLTQAERDALAEGLVSDRQNAHYADVQQRAGDASAVPAQQARLPEEQLQPIDLNNIPPPATPAPNPVLPRPAPRPSALPPIAPLPPVAQAPRVTSVAPVAASGSSHLSVGGGFAAPIAASRESSLKTPAPREEPQAETPAEPPAAPALAPVPPPEPVKPLVQGHAAPDSSAAAVGGVPVPPAAPIRSEPTPSAPQLAAAPTVEPAAAPPVPGKRQTSVPAARVEFDPLSTTLPPDAAASLKGVPAQMQGHDAIVRIVGHAAVTGASGDAAGRQLAAYQSALARAAAVKQALVAAGIDPAKIQTEAAPTQAGASDRADVLVEY